MFVQPENKFFCLFRDDLLCGIGGSRIEGIFGLISDVCFCGIDGNNRIVGILLIIGGIAVVLE